MCLVLYVSGHGLGHATRAITWLQQLPEQIPVVVKTASPQWHWRGELPNRPFEYVETAFDVGTVQHDSLGSDATATLAAWRDTKKRNDARFADECADLQKRGARLVVSDVPPFALTVAAQIGVPSVCVANFTWADIYDGLGAQEPELHAVADELRAEYVTATMCLDAGLSLPMPYFPRKEVVGIIARAGADRQAELWAHLPDAARNKRLALVYAGNWGLPIPYPKLSRFDDWHFLSLGSTKGDLPANFSLLPRSLMAHPDLVASVDVVVSKAGYGLVGECLAGGIPIIYCQREGFAEFGVIDDYLSQRPHGVRVSVETFASGEWGETLAGIPARGTLPREAVPGATNAARIIAGLYG